MAGSHDACPQAANWTSFKKLMTVSVLAVVAALGLMALFLI